MAFGRRRSRIEQHPANWRCRLGGCAIDFRADGRMLRWECARGCPTTGSKEYPTAEDAERMAWGLAPRPARPATFLTMGIVNPDREDREQGGGRPRR